MTRVLVCGGRDYADWKTVSEVLDEVHRRRGIRVLIHGAARGADTLAARWARGKGICTIAVEANWSAYGGMAGGVRNGWMLDHCKPIDLVITFPGGRGTKNMREKALGAYIELLEIKPKQIIKAKAGRRIL